MKKKELPTQEYKVLFHLSNGTVLDTYMTQDKLDSFIYMQPPTLQINNTIIMTAHLLYIEIYEITKKVITPEEEPGTTSYIGSN